MWWLVVLLALLLTQKEGFSVQVKADLGSVGIAPLLNVMSTQTNQFYHAVWERMPFRAQMNALNRRLRRRNFINRKV